MPIDFSKFKPSPKEQPSVDPIAIFTGLELKTHQSTIFGLLKATHCVLGIQTAIKRTWRFHSIQELAKLLLACS
jgi:hypothetical protein